MKKANHFLTFLLIFIGVVGFSQSEIEKNLIEISTATSPERIEKDIKSLVNFGTRHTLSDTVSKIRGIGAARRWIKSTFEEVSENCDNCLEVIFLGDIIFMVLYFLGIVTSDIIL